MIRYLYVILVKSADDEFEKFKMTDSIHETKRKLDYRRKKSLERWRKRTKKRQSAANLPSDTGAQYDEDGRLLQPVTIPGSAPVSGDGFTNF